MLLVKSHDLSLQSGPVDRNALKEDSQNDENGTFDYKLGNSLCLTCTVAPIGKSPFGKFRWDRSSARSVTAVGEIEFLMVAAGMFERKCVFPPPLKEELKQEPIKRDANISKIRLKLMTQSIK